MSNKHWISKFWQSKYVQLRHHQTCVEQSIKICKFQQSSWTAYPTRPKCTFSSNCQTFKYFNRSGGVLMYRSLFAFKPQLLRKWTIANVNLFFNHSPRNVRCTNTNNSLPSYEFHVLYVPNRLKFFEWKSLNIYRCYCHRLQIMSAFRFLGITTHNYKKQNEQRYI